MTLNDLAAIKKNAKPKNTFEAVETLHLLPWRDQLVHVRVVGGRSYDQDATLEVNVLSHGPQGFTTVSTMSLPETCRFRVEIQGDTLLIFGAQKNEEDRSLLVLPLTNLADPWVALPFAPADEPVVIDKAGFLYARYDDALVIHSPAREGAKEIARLPVEWERDKKGFRDLALSGSHLVLLGPADYTGLKLIDIADPRAPKVLQSFVGKFNAPDHLLFIRPDKLLAYGIGDKAHAFRIEGDRLMSEGTVAVGDRYERAIVEGDSALLFGGYKKGERATVVSIGGGKPEKKGVVTFADSPVGLVLGGTGYYFASSDGVSSF